MIELHMDKEIQLIEDPDRYVSGQGYTNVPFDEEEPVPPETTMVEDEDDYDLIGGYKDEKTKF